MNLNNVLLALCFCFFATGFKSFAQDIIILKNGDEIPSKVMEVSTDIVKYKKWDNQEGPLYTSQKSEIFMIKYQNGTKDVFNTAQPANKPVAPVDNFSQVVEMARTHMTKQIHTESNGACKILEFSKQNGIERNVLGQKLYTLEYRLIIELQRDFWKASGDKWLAADWYWESFAVLEQKGDVYAETFTNNYAYFTKGSRVEITGKMDFESTDNGWRLTGINMFSAGYDNNSSRILPPLNPTPTVKPAIKKEADVPVDPLKDTYIGEYLDGKKHGRGKMIYKNGNTYEGDWKGDKKDGYGKKVYKDGSFYEGGWKEDKMEGNGTIVDAIGQKFVGHFVNNEMDGKGIKYDKNGNKVSENNYKNGYLIGHYFTVDEDKEGNIMTREGVSDSTGLNGQETSVTKLKSGSIVTFNGEIKNGEWYNGKLITTIPEAPGFQWEIVIKDGKEGKKKKVKIEGAKKEK